MSSDPLWSFPTGSIVEGIQVDSVLTQEFTDFQNHWLSADKTIMFPESSFDTTEVKSSCMLYWHSYSLTYACVYICSLSLLMMSTKQYLLYWTL